MLLVHPGGPLWARRDEGAWSLPKGEYDEREDPLSVAEREFEEELGHPPPPGPRLSLGSVRQAGGKEVVAWAVRGDLDPATTTSNTFTLEWPRGSGRWQTFPEVDQAAWWELATEAPAKVLSGQRPLLERLEAALAGPTGPGR